MSKTPYRNLEQGKREVPMHVLRRVAHVLGTTEEGLLALARQRIAAAIAAEEPDRIELDEPPNGVGAALGFE